MAFGLLLDAIPFGWMASVAAPDPAYGRLVPAAAVLQPARQAA
jgi:hypothetical protein